MLVLETERTRLRWLTPDDAPFILALLNEPGWIRFIGDRGVHDIDAARAYLEQRLVPAYERLGFGFYALELKAGGSPAGICGLIKRDGLDDVDLGFALLAPYEGRGLAGEAAAATLAHARDDLGLRRVAAIATPDNARSTRLLERLGMRFERLVRLPGDTVDLRLYAIDLGP